MNSDTSSICSVCWFKIMLLNALFITNSLEMPFQTKKLNFFWERFSPLVRSFSTPNLKMRRRLRMHSDSENPRFAYEYRMKVWREHTVITAHWNKFIETYNKITRSSIQPNNNTNHLENINHTQNKTVMYFFKSLTWKKPKKMHLYYTRLLVKAFPLPILHYIT